MNKEIDNYLINNDVFRNTIIDDIKILLKEFERVMNTGHKSDDEIIMLAKNSFLINMIRDKDKTIEDLVKIIKLKKVYPEFRMIYNPDSDSFCSLGEVSITLSSKYNVFMFNHELEHILHYAYQNGDMPQKMDELLPEYIVKPLMKYLAKELSNVLSNKLKSEEYYKNKFEDFLVASKKQLTEEEKDKLYVKFKEECIKRDTPEYIGFQDILDAYSCGYLDEYYKDNKSIYYLCTHDKEYYSKSKEIRFAEIYANYVALLNLQMVKSI